MGVFFKTTTFDCIGFKAEKKYIKKCQKTLENQIKYEKGAYQESHGYVCDKEL